METNALAMNTNLGPTKDIAVRQAINHAADKDTMIATVLYGTQKRADTLFAPNVPYANLGLKPYAYDPALAVGLLDYAIALQAATHRLKLLLAHLCVVGFVGVPSGI